MATFVCVHGAFQGGWVWKQTAAALFSLGHQALAPTFSGCGHHRHTLARDMGLGTYVADLVQFFELEDLTGVILVAHSYAGLVCLGALPAIGPRLAGLVCVEAILPKAGLSFADLGGEPFRAMLAARQVDGWLVAPWPAAMFGVAGAPDEDWFMSRLAPFPLAGFTDRLPAAEPALPARRHYIRCAQNPNPMLAAMADRAASLGFAPHSLESGHCPQVTIPVELARLLATLAEDAAGPA
jgi:pimeloyl-ACP methyl ester carboxylesterase